MFSEEYLSDADYAAAVNVVREYNNGKAWENAYRKLAL